MNRQAWRSDRLDRLGSAIFSEVAGWKAAARSAGLDVIQLDIGSPDRPPAMSIRERLAEASLRPELTAIPARTAVPLFA